MKRFFLIMCLLLPNLGWAENLSLEWPKQKYKSDACIINVDPQSWQYQHTFKIAGVAYRDFNDIFQYILWPVGELEVTKHRYEGSLLILMGFNQIDYGPWVEMPSCP